MSESIEVSTVLPASPEVVYQAWMDSEEHTWMTGSDASVEEGVGGRFTAWEGYISGTTLELVPYSRIVQAWRTTEFPPGSPDSRLEVRLEPAEGGTQITLIHTGIPDGQGESYRQGWLDWYFAPMKRYFEARRVGQVGATPVRRRTSQRRRSPR